LLCQHRPILGVALQSSALIARSLFDGQQFARATAGLSRNPRVTLRNHRILHGNFAAGENVSD
jgi:hypothetical protein